ncbi:MAG: septum formation protein Maf [bacterium]|nr:septum formation protein Maf [bacterium]
MTYPNLTALATRHPLVLGSGSPRRLQLLGEIGIPFTQRIPDIHESIRQGEAPYDYALRLAEEKALVTAISGEVNEISLGCDTIVVLGNRVLEKPTDPHNALQILTLLSGQQHVVCSAVAFARHSGLLASDYELTKVYFNPITTQQIQEYIDTGEPMDKAGAYGIQGMGAFLVDRIDGNLDTVVGLPRALIERLAGEILFIV